MPMKLLEITWGVKMEHPNQSGYLGAPSFTGVPSFKIKPKYLRAALNLLIKGTYRLKQKNVVKQICELQKTKDRKTIENTISIKLVEEMQKEQERYNIRADILTPNLIHSCKNIEYSQIDIRFTWNNYSPNGYLAVEAKLLFGRVKRLGGPYVEEGVMDFVNEKYSWGHSHGIMAGYVLSEPINKAILAVEKALKKRKDETNETSPFCEDNFIDYSLLFNSVHKQGNNGREIKILHIFFDFAS